MTQTIELKPYLDSLVDRFERPTFIAEDPISIPHGFDDPADREVIGLFAAVLAWGRRATMLRKLEDLCERMRYRPAAFVYDFDAAHDGGRLAGFAHRTFQPEDALHLTRSLSALLRRHGSIESVFATGMKPGDDDVEGAIQTFSDAVLTGVRDVPPRLRKHLARPSTGSACKRLAMYLRWMVRPGPVDFGQWASIAPRQLVVPLDVHTGRHARLLGLLDRSADDWRAVRQLTSTLRRFAPEDPVRYDFALFGAGIHDVRHPDAVVISDPSRRASS